MMKISLLRRMMSAKIRSNRGASLIFALLLFLVCTVIGSVVLAAGTASAGRMSKLGESDQRYYSVTSAAQLLAKELTDKEIRIVRTRQETETTKYKLENDKLIEKPGFPEKTYAYETTLYRRNTTDTGEYIFESENPSIYSYKEIKKVTDPDQPFYSTTDKRSFLSERAVNYLFGSQNCNKDTAMGLSFSSSENEESGTFTMEHSNNNEILKITGKYNVEKDGTIILTLWDKITEEEASQHFSLVIRLQPEFHETERTFTDNTDSSPKPDPDSPGSYIATTVTTTIKTSDVTWKLGTITKNAAAE